MQLADPWPHRTHDWLGLALPKLATRVGIELLLLRLALHAIQLAHCRDDVTYVDRVRRLGFDKLAPGMRHAASLIHISANEDLVIAGIGVCLQHPAILVEKRHRPGPTSARCEIENDFVAIANVRPQEAASPTLLVIAIDDEHGRVVGLHDIRLEHRCAHRSDDRLQHVSRLPHPVAHG